MRYLALIYGNETAGTTMSEAEVQAEKNAYNEFGDFARERAVLLGGEALVPTSSATTVRLRDGKLLTTDGPFAETKETVGRILLAQLQRSG